MRAARGWLAAGAALLAIASAGHAQAACGTRRSAVGDIGVEMFHCVAGSCGIRDGVQDRFYTFSIEPQVWNVDPDGPAAGRLRDRDVVVRVDGRLITSPEGGRHLANLTPGVPATLEIRRDGRQREVSITPAPACSLPMLIWTRDPTGTAPRLGIPDDLEGAGGRLRIPPPSERPGPPAPAASLGLSVSCEDCGWYFNPGGELLWRSATEPVVVDIEPGGAASRGGLAEGDVLTHIDGEPIRSEAGGARLARLEPGEVVVIRYRRGTGQGTATLRADRPPSG